MFDLFSPADVEKLYVVGPLSYVHSNGRINYGTSSRTVRRCVLPCVCGVALVIAVCERLVAAPEPTSADGRAIGAEAAADMEAACKAAEEEVRVFLFLRVHPSVSCRSLGCMQSR